MTAHHGSAFRDNLRPYRRNGTSISPPDGFRRSPESFWPDGKTARLANLRGEGAYDWDYIVLCADPYIMANFPGLYAEGVKLIHGEVAKGSAQLVLLAQYSGAYTSINPFQMKHVPKRVVSYRETGASTEDRLADALNRLDDVCRITALPSITCPPQPSGEGVLPPARRLNQSF